MDVFQAIAVERRQLVADLSDLTPDQWATASLCGDWTVHDVVAHLTVPLTVSFPRSAMAVVRRRGNLDRAIADLTEARASLPIEQLLHDLEDKADSRFAPPGAGARAPLSDILIHGEDIRRPLGMAHVAPDDVWAASLSFLTGNRAVGFVPRGRTRGLALEASDVGWSWGSGARLRGPAVSIALALTGRPEGLDDLDGAGVDLLRDRITSTPAPGPG